jgi:uncharacterized phage protein gp47/JayE
LTGYVRETEEEVFKVFEREGRTLIHPALDSSPDSVFGQFSAIVATKVAELGEAQGEIYESFSENADGAALDRVCAYSGTKRNGPFASTLTANVTLAPGDYAAHSIVATVTDKPDARFWNTDIASNPGSGNAVIRVPMVATAVGPVRAPVGTLRTLVAPPSGVLAIDNEVDADIGSLTEIDPRLRVRRRRELGLAALGPVGAIRSALSAIKGVNDVRVYTNRSMQIDAAGRAPKSVEALVLGGDPQKIAQAIWKNVGFGIEMVGTSSQIIVDEEGNNQTVFYARPIARRIWVRLSGNRQEGYPGDDAVKQTVSDFSDGTIELVATNGAKIEGEVAIGGLIYRSKIAAAALTVSGVRGIATVEFSTDGASWVNADYQLAPREFLGHLNERGIQSGDVVVQMAI